MVLKLYTEGHFSSAHFLNDYSGKCAQIHGHTWKLSVWVKGDEQLLQTNGMLWDFNNIKEAIKELDHVNLNVVLNKNPTAENIALHIYHSLKKGAPKLAFKVRVYENPIPPLAYCETGDF